MGQHGKGLTIVGGISEYVLKKPRIYLVDSDGNVPADLKGVIHLVSDAGIILNLGDTSFTEMQAVVQQAKRQNVKKIVCDHPFFSHLDTSQQIVLADQGVWINYTAGELLPRWWRVSITDFAAAIQKDGVKRSVISSDCGQLHNPPMVEALRMTCQMLLEEGFTADEIRTPLHHNPPALLYP